MDEVVYYCGRVKMSHKGFRLSILESLMKDWTGGFYLVMKSAPRVPGDRPIVSIVYK